MSCASGCCKLRVTVTVDSEYVEYEETWPGESDRESALVIKLMGQLSMIHEALKLEA